MVSHIEAFLCQNKPSALTLVKRPPIVRVAPQHCTLFSADRQY